MADVRAWAPGNPITIETRRLVLSTLLPREVLDEDVSRWAGEGSRSENVWKPPMPIGDYMRGLSAACDNRQTFVLKIVHKATELIVGYLKAQIDPRDDSLIATTILGDGRFSGGNFGAEATREMHRFFFMRTNVKALRPRVYARNEGTQRILKRFGYVEESRYAEQTGGEPQQVCIFYISREDWLAGAEEIDAAIARQDDITRESLGMN